MGENPLQAYAVHLIEHFLGRMRPEKVAGLKKTCISWKTAPLQDIMQHAEHAEGQLWEKEQTKKGARQMKLEDVQLTMYQAMTKQTDRGRGKGCGRDRRRAQDRGAPNNQQQTYDPYACYLCGQNLKMILERYCLLLNTLKPRTMHMKLIA